MVAQAKDHTSNNPTSGLPPLAIVIARCQSAQYMLLRIHHNLCDARSLHILGKIMALAWEGADVAANRGFAEALPYIAE